MITFIIFQHLFSFISYCRCRSVDVLCFSFSFILFRVYIFNLKTSLYLSNKLNRSLKAKKARQRPKRKTSKQDKKPFKTIQKVTSGISHDQRCFICHYVLLINFIDSVTKCIREASWTIRSTVLMKK